MGGPLARVTIERLSHVGKREQHVSVSVSGLGIHSILSAHPFLLRWLQGYSVALVSLQHERAPKSIWALEQILIPPEYADAN